MPGSRARSSSASHRALRWRGSRCSFWCCCWCTTWGRRSPTSSSRCWATRRSATTPTCGCTGAASAASRSALRARPRRDEPGLAGWQRASANRTSVMSGLDVRAFTVGPVQENCYITRPAEAEAEAAGATADKAVPAIIVDPGEEAERLLDAARSLGVELQAILVTHCHFDHIGAVAPLAAATGAPVYCPEIEQPVLADIMRWVPPGFGPFESYVADHTLAGGERLNLAGMDVEVLFTPGHSPGHLTYAISPAAAERGAQDAARDAGAGVGGAAGADAPVLFSGDVLFAGSVGRVDLPGGDWAMLESSIGSLLRAFPPQTGVYPGHMGITTLGRERDTNPFLAELRSVEHAVAEAQAASPRR